MRSLTQNPLCEVKGCRRVAYWLAWIGPEPKYPVPVCLDHYFPVKYSYDPEYQSIKKKSQSKKTPTSRTADQSL